MQSQENLSSNHPLYDFRNFLFLAWEHLGLPNPTPVQYDIAQYIQNGPKRRCVQAFRGVGKSWITSAYVCHQLLLDPSRNILVVSASKQRADDFSTFTLRLIDEMPVLQHLKPKENQRNSKIAFDVGPAPASHAPSVTSKGITSQITGARADIIVADDTESLNNSATQMMRDKLSEAIKEFDAVLKPDGQVIYLGTPQTEQSIYNALPNRGYDVKIWPSRYPTEKQKEMYGNRLAPKVSEELENNPDLATTPTDKDRFDEFDLLEREASYGKAGFALQFMLDTTLSDQDLYPLKLSDLIVMAVNPENAPDKPIWSTEPDLAYKDLPCVGFNGDRYYRPMAITGEWRPYDGSVMAIDPSGRGADETAYAVVKALNGFLYVTAAGGIKGGYSEDSLKELSLIAKRQGVNLVLVESNFGDGMFTELLRPVINKIHKVTLEEVRHNIQKERRIIDTLEPVMSSHRLVIDEAIIKNDYASTQDLGPEKALQYQLFYQMTRVTRQRGALRHDDRLDVLAMAVGHWSESMAQDIESRIQARREEALRDDLENFMEHAIHKKPSPRTWM
mgnify:CR=1 FL=1